MIPLFLKVKPSPGPPTAMSAQHLAQVVPPILEYVNKKQIAAAENQLLLQSDVSTFHEQFNKSIIFIVNISFRLLIMM